METPGFAGSRPEGSAPLTTLRDAEGLMPEPGCPQFQQQRPGSHEGSLTAIEPRGPAWPREAHPGRSARSPPFNLGTAEGQSQKVHKPQKGLGFELFRAPMMHSESWRPSRHPSLKLHFYPRGPWSQACHSRAHSTART